MVITGCRLQVAGCTLQDTGYKLQVAGCVVRQLLLFVFVLGCLSGVQAQPRQEVPPFLKPQKTTQTVELDGKAYRLPDFSIAPRLPSGGPEFISQTPFGFLAVRETNKGFALDLRRYRDVFRAAELFRSAPNPLLVTEGLGRTPNGPVFDFTKSAPHLAFFCRLEINEKKGGVIPAKFRLGGVRHWQDELGRRE